MVGVTRERRGTRKEQDVFMRSTKVNTNSAHGHICKHTVPSMRINMQDTNQTGVKQQKASFKGGRIMFSLIFCHKNYNKMMVAHIKD